MIIKKILTTLLTTLIAFLVLVSSPTRISASSNCPISYDFNGDGQVDVQDLQALSFNIGKQTSDPDFDSKYDLNNDGKIDSIDLQLINNCLNPSAGSFNLPESPATNLPETGFIGQLISAFLPPILALSGFIAVIIIVISGIQFMTSSGNPEGAAAARGRLTFALIGFVIIILAFAILQIINKIFLGTGVA